MTKPIRFLSLFSGIEVASLAWNPLGWQCVAVAEIEKFPSQVLAYHYPDVPNLGDITKITEQTIKALGHIDVVIFGFPCQDLSFAGKRAGLKTEDGKVTRSGLFFTAMQIARWSGARFALAENVPGLLSSKQGTDFAAVVGEMAGAYPNIQKGKWQNSGCLLGPDGLVEWATLDAQYFGVPQRRRRVFIVRDIGDWASRQPILLEQESLFGNPAPSCEKREKIAPHSNEGTNENGGFGTEFDCDGSLVVSEVAQLPCWWDGGQLSQTLDAVLSKGQCMPEKNRFPAVLVEKPVTYSIRTANTSSNGWGIQEEVTHTLDQAMGIAVATEVAVRRLTPRECERLQGIPDDYTLIPTGKKMAADSPRYKALGNSFAVPCIQWIGKRIERAIEQDSNSVSR